MNVSAPAISSVRTSANPMLESAPRFCVPMDYFYIVPYCAIPNEAGPQGSRLPGAGELETDYGLRRAPPGGAPPATRTPVA
eukprot:CAMPEP_0118942522 /NCGR_PEP_ID=MMETSP1169-20130426/36348_1 /TAXON_ID=36882 /ORGANISM="Pyramimonas obovata, Strain CCMP722" /LENGTH=80 /DNA_ID=CAMNT_0006887551 /DNA_START=144 /DNA_END=386 /DNA_ORIENTATION=+